MESAGLFALCAAAFLALRDVFGRFAVRGGDPIVGTAASAILGLPVLALISALYGDFRHPWPAESWALASIALAGILRITAARTLLFAATQHIGAARAGTLAATNIFFAVSLGMVFLGERLTFLSGTGVLLVISGYFLMARSGGGQASLETDVHPWRGVALALMSALAFGASSVLVRPSVSTFASPNQANLYANLFAVFAYLPFVWRRLPTADVMGWPLRRWGLLTLAGSAASLGVTFIYLALARAPVVFVIPIAQSRPLFLVLLSWLILQAYENVNLRVAAGATAICGGTTLLIMYR